MKVNFFDLGSYDGMESKIMLDIFNELGINNYNIYVFEPSLKSFENVKENLKNKLNVNLYNLGISNENSVGKLYHSFVGNEVGHSIFSTKNNVKIDEYEEIKLVKFSDWCKKNLINFENAYNIIKFNIEGAEWHLINDLIDNNLIDKFNLYCGDGSDIYKISELKDNQHEYENKLLKYKINIIPFSAQGIDSELNRVNREKEIIKNKIREYERV